MPCHFGDLANKSRSIHYTLKGSRLISHLLQYNNPQLKQTQHAFNRNLEARGTAAFAHAAAQLPAEYGEEVASLLQRLRSKLMGFAAEGGSPWDEKLPKVNC